MRLLRLLALCCILSPLVGFSDAKADVPSIALSVPEREDHSPFITTTPANQPLLLWVATAPDTNVAGVFDELILAEHDATGWLAPVVLAGPGNYFTPSAVFTADGARWICWADLAGNDSQIRIRWDHADSTQTFTLGDGFAPDLEPSICAAHADTVIVVWQGWRTDNYEILMSVGTPAGFSQPQIISGYPRSDRDPEVVWGNNKAWIVWSSYRGEPYNLLCRTFDGTTLTPAVQLTTSYRARNLHPKLAFDEDHDLLWVTSIWVNQGWSGFNNNEFPGLYDVGTPRIRVFDGLTVFEPTGLNANKQFPLVPMENLGFERFMYDGGTRPMLDRYGPGLSLLVEPGGRMWCFYKQIGTITELGAPNRYWGVVGLNYDTAAWSSPTQFVERRTSLAWESPAICQTSDSLWVAWSADDRTGPVFPNFINLFGDNLNIRVTSQPKQAAAILPPVLVPIGLATAPAGVGPDIAHPSFSTQDGDTTRNLYWGDLHRHSLDFSWDADIDPPIQQTLMYALDFLGDDFIMPADHSERYSPGAWALMRKWTQIMNIPGRFCVFPGYERSMQGAAGGHQNVVYRDPQDYVAATAAFPVVNNWHTMYNAQAGIDVLSIPHTTAQCGVVTNWPALANGNVDSLPPPLRLVEVYQSLRESYEYPDCPLESWECTVGPTQGWVNVALAIGMKLGLCASSDHTVRACFTGVYAPECNRDAIFQGLYDRRCFGTSKATKMNVDFRIEGKMEGSEVEAYPHPTLSVTIDHTAPLPFIEINKDGNPSWFVASCAGSDTAFTVVDFEDAVPGSSSTYYLRVRDNGNNVVWTSPIWVTFLSPIETDSPVVAASSMPLSLQAFPNPSATDVAFEVDGLASPGGVLRVHDVGGRLVRKIIIPPGSSHTRIPWDRRDASGRQVAAGIYYGVVSSGRQNRNTSVVLLK